VGTEFSRNSMMLAWSSAADQADDRQNRGTYRVAVLSEQGTRALRPAPVDTFIRAANDLPDLDVVAEGVGLKTGAGLSVSAVAEGVAPLVVAEVAPGDGAGVQSTDISQSKRTTASDRRHPVP
jgi:hypothetical protein